MNCVGCGKQNGRGTKICACGIAVAPPLRPGARPPTRGGPPPRRGKAAGRPPERRDASPLPPPRGGKSSSKPPKINRAAGSAPPASESESGAPDPEATPTVGLRIQDSPNGIRVTALRADPAIVAGFQKGDIIVSLNSKKVDKEAKLLKLLKDIYIGQSMKFGITREGESMQLKLIVGAKAKPGNLLGGIITKGQNMIASVAVGASTPPPLTPDGSDYNEKERAALAKMQAAQASWEQQSGLQKKKKLLGLPNIDTETKQKPLVGIGFEDVKKNGNTDVVVTRIRAEPAKVAGLLKGDVILEVNETKIFNGDVLRVVFKRVDVGDTMTFKVKRGTETLTLPLIVGEKKTKSSDKTPEPETPEQRMQREKEEEEQRKYEEEKQKLLTQQETDKRLRKIEVEQQRQKAMEQRAAKRLAQAEAQAAEGAKRERTSTSAYTLERPARPPPLLPPPAFR